MNAAPLLVIFVIAKIMVLWGRPLSISIWTPIAYGWQDVAVVLLLALFARIVRRQWPTRLVYAVLVVVTALNVPVQRVLSTPITMSMLRATRGALSDSIWHEATAVNLGCTLVLLMLGVALPFVWGMRPPANRAWLVAGIVFVLLGPVAVTHVDTRGLERNPIAALVRSALPRISATSDETDWRTPLAVVEQIESIAGVKGASAGRNVLLIVLEGNGAQYLKPWGAMEDPMPRLTELAERSLVFDNAYTVYPESVKGLVAILASRYPGFDVPAERHADIMTPSIASVLAGAGYRTGLFHSGRFMYLGMEQLLAHTGFDLLEDAGDIGGNHESSFGIDEPAAVHRILSWIDQTPRGKHFFAAYLPIAGHHPYAYSGASLFPPTADIGRYRNALHEGDQALGELFDALQTRGIADSTVIVVISDHAEAFGQHSGNVGHDLALYEENVHVPLLIHMPGASNKTGHVHQVVSLLDLAPTILDILGQEIPAPFQGQSLLSGKPMMALFFTDYSLGLLGLRDGCMKDIYEMESKRSRLFDVCHDPNETKDLTSQIDGRAAAYRDLLLRWSAAQVGRVNRE